jgi:hypothetical protein
MRRWRLWITLLLVALGLLSLGYYLGATLNLSALQRPGKVETYVATKAKRWLVARSARGIMPPAAAEVSTSLMYGQWYFSCCCSANAGAMCAVSHGTSSACEMCFSCASCHGQDGRTPTVLGRSLYPPAPDLGSPTVQQYADAELFVVVKQGIRLTGMPGFGHIFSDEEIWHLVHYVRSLGAPSRL